MSKTYINVVIVFIVIWMGLWGASQTSWFNENVMYFFDKAEDGNVMVTDSHSIPLPSKWVIANSHNRQFTIYHLNESSETLTIMFLVNDKHLKMASNFVEVTDNKFPECKDIKGILIDGEISSLLYGSKTGATVLLDSYSGKYIKQICEFFSTI